MSTDPWNKRPSHDDWSDQVEKEEAQKGGHLDGNSFPTISQASKQKGRKKGGQAMSLGQFMAQETDNSSASRPRFSRPQTDAEILMSLPKQPKQRDPNEESQSRWSGRRGGYHREDRPRRQQREEEYVPSRADESNNWGTDKRSTYPPQSGSRSYDRPHSRGSSRGYEERSDGGESWSNTRYSGGGGGGGGGGTSGGGNRSGFSNFHDHDRDRRQGYGFHSSHQGSYNNRGPEDKWSHSSSNQHSYQSGAVERKKLVLDKRTVPISEAVQGTGTGTGTDHVPPKPKSNPFGAARPREEVLKERGADVNSCEVYSSRSDILSDHDYKSQSGSPGGSYRGSTTDLSESQHHPPTVVKKIKPKSEDPFGGARPREEVLHERGVDDVDQENDQQKDFDHQPKPYQQLSQVKEMSHRIEAM